MQNPWLDLPDAASFVAPVDAPQVGRLGSRLQGPFELRLDLLPQPWTGNVNTAEVFVLALNPGFSEADCADLQNPDYAQQWRRTPAKSTDNPIGREVSL